MLYLNIKLKSILIVEDDDNLRKLYTEVFKGSGYAVTEAIDPNAAMELLKENSYDVILLDLLFPSMDGEDVIKFIRSGKTTNTKIPVIAMTNLTDDEKIKKVLELGATKCIFKSDNTPKSVFNEVQAVVNSINGKNKSEVKIGNNE